jgi:selenocysteine lyase/cysteine desulfurase
VPLVKDVKSLSEASGILYGRHDLLQTIEFPKLQPAHDAAPEKAETGTLDHEGIAGAAAAVDFFASLTGQERLACSRGVFCSHGDFYAMTVVERLDLSETGLLRAGCAGYTTADEILRLVEAIRLIRT